MIQATKGEAVLKEAESLIRGDSSEGRRCRDFRGRRIKCGLLWL